MGDMGDIFRTQREWSKVKRRSNRESSTQRLKDNNISYVSKSGGVHLIIENRIDFWPGTGKWIYRTGRQGRGVGQLIESMNREKQGRLG